VSAAACQENSDAPVERDSDEPRWGYPYATRSLRLQLLHTLRGPQDELLYPGVLGILRGCAWTTCSSG